MASHADRETNCMPELITLRNEHARLLTEITTLRAQLAEAQASERERCAKAVENTSLETGRGHQRKTRMSYQAIQFRLADRIRALSPTPNQEKPDGS